MKRALATLFLLACVGAQLSAGSGESPAVDEAALPRILSRLDGIARRYRDEALRFTCEEKIIHSRPDRPSRFFSFEYIYEFSDAAGLIDYRVDTRVPHRGGKLPARARLSDYELPYYLTRGYSWVFLFDQAHQPRHRYSMGNQTSILGRAALPISFEPVPPIESDFNDWSGTLWVDIDSLLPLRVEAMKLVEREKEQAFQAALASTDPIRGAVRDGWIYARVATEFTYEVNAMRFPGKVTLTGTHGKIRIRKGKRVPDERTLFTVTQLYSDYRFFGVKTEEAIRTQDRETRD